MPTDAKQETAQTSAQETSAFARLVTRDDAMRRIFSYLAVIARTREPVLISGETGTGKDLVARALHAIGGGGEFVAIGVGGLDDAGFATALFGRGDGTPGAAQRALGGTLYLDEIAELSANGQGRLLRLLQEGEAGGGARVVAATSRDHGQLQQAGTLKPELLYRLRSHHVRLPPLRERRDDLPLLLEHFAAEAAEALGRVRPAIPAELPRLLAGYAFPGNVRELRALVLDAVSRCTDGRIQLEPFRQAIAAPAGHEHTQAEEVSFPARLPSLREVQELLVAEALRRARGNQAMAARWMGITRQGLNKRLRTRAGQRAPTVTASSDAGL